MAENGGGEGEEGEGEGKLPRVDHDPLNEGARGGPQYFWEVVISFFGLYKPPVEFQK